MTALEPPASKTTQQPTSIKEILDILGVTVKRDEATKATTFLGMILCYTDEDQFNIGFQSESASGKSYIPLELVEFFPEEDKVVLASASPTAFFHDTGAYDQNTNTIHIDLEKKILLFLDMPHYQLLEKLRPLLSHDQKELKFKITDKNTKGGLKTKNVIIKGYPVVIFCSTSAKIDDQEKTRMFILSPETSQQKIDDAIKLLAEKLGDRQKYKQELDSNNKRNSLRQRIRELKEANIRQVIIQNSDDVANRFLNERPHLAPRHQRDFPRLMALIKAHALLNWAYREPAGENAILASEEDAEAAFNLYGDIAKPNELGLAPQIFNVYREVIKPLLDDNGDIRREQIFSEYYRRYHRPLPEWRLRQEFIPQLSQAGLIAEKPDEHDKRRMLIYSPTGTSDIDGDEKVENTTYVDEMPEVELPPTVEECDDATFSEPDLNDSKELERQAELDEILWAERRQEPATMEEATDETEE